MKPIVIIESPYAAKNPDGSLDHIGIEINVEYARACMRDSLLRGEAPYASHLLYTQPVVLRDEVPEDRELGITAGFEFKRVADVIAVYTDLGISPGMQRAIDLERESNIESLRYEGHCKSRIDERSLPEWAGLWVARRKRHHHREFGGTYLCKIDSYKGGTEDIDEATRFTRAEWLHHTHEYRADFFYHNELLLVER